MIGVFVVVEYLVMFLWFRRVGKDLLEDFVLVFVFYWVSLFIIVDVDVFVNLFIGVRFGFLKIMDFVGYLGVVNVIFEV